MERIKVFLDSNVFISGLYSEKGSPGIILDSFINGKIEVSVSRKVLDETIAVIKNKLPGILPVLRDFLVQYPPEIIKNPESSYINKWKNILNDADAMILGAAISCDPDYFITGDKHFFESIMIEKSSGLKILRPNDFIRNLDNIQK